MHAHTWDLINTCYFRHVSINLRTYSTTPWSWSRTRSFLSVKGCGIHSRDDLLFPLRTCNRTEGCSVSAITDKGWLWHRLSHGGQHLHGWQEHVHICHWWRGQWVCVHTLYMITWIPKYVQGWDAGALCILFFCVQPCVHCVLVVVFVWEGLC